MDIKQTLSQLDKLLEQQDMAGAARFLDRMAEQAEFEDDTTARLTLYNEIIGFHRVSGNREKSYGAADKALALLREKGMDVPHDLYAANEVRAYIMKLWKEGV